MRRELTLFMLALVVHALPAGLCRASASADRLACVANGDHLWFVANVEKSDEIVICHHALDLMGPYFKSQANLSQAPEALASWGNRLWVSFPRKPGADSSHRDVFTLQVQKEPALGMYFPIPSGRLDIVNPMPGLGMLAAFEGSADGLVALLVPYQRSSAGVTGPKDSTASEPDLDHPRLMRLQNDNWIDLDLPQGFTGLGSSLLVASGDGHELSLLTNGPHQSRSILFERNLQGAWTSTEFDLDMHTVRDLVSVRGQVAAVVEDHPNGEVVVEYLRSTGIVPLTRLPMPAGVWTIVGLGSQLRLLEVARSGSFAMTAQDIHPLNGFVDVKRTMEVQPITAGRLWQVSLLLAFSISGMLLVFIIRPAGRGEVAIPKGMEAAPMTIRFSALAIDMFPAAVLTMLIMKCSLTELVTTPMLTVDLEQSLPYFVLVGLTMAHSTFSELIWQSTLGKGLMGLRVLGTDGQSLPRRRTFMRNLLKAMVLLVPPLAVFGAVNPNMQGLPELASKSLVVREATEQIEPD